MKKSSMLRVPAAAMLLAAGALCLGGCKTSSESRRVAGNSDEYFLVWAREANLAEIATGELAMEEAATEEVRAYGEEMVEAHRRADAQLERLAEGKGVDLPSETDQAHRALTRHLEELDGEAFDREYIGAMVADHEKALAMFESRAESASDPQVRAWAQEMVPVLAEHLDRAQRLQEQLEMVSPARTTPSR